jgi:hypothetical protein
VMARERLRHLAAAGVADTHKKNAKRVAQC